MTQDNQRNRPLKPEKNLKDAPLPPLPFAHHIKQGGEADREKEILKITQKEGPLTVQESLKLAENLKNKQKLIKNKLNEMYEQMGMTPEYLRTYLNNPNNFTPEQWENIQKQREKLLAKFNRFSHSEETKPSTTSPSDAKSTKGRKKGFARRGWLPMR